MLLILSSSFIPHIQLYSVKLTWHVVSWGFWVIDSIRFHAAQLFPNQIPSCTPANSERRDWEAQRLAEAPVQHQGSRGVSLAASRLKNFTYAILISKNVVKCSVKLQLFLGTVFLNSPYKSQPEMWSVPKPLAREMRNLPHAGLKRNGDCDYF